MDFIPRINGKSSIFSEQGSGVIICVFERSPENLWADRGSSCGGMPVLCSGSGERTEAGTTASAVKREQRVRILKDFGGIGARSR